MPIVTAPSKAHNNGDTVTEFVDTASTTLTTWTFAAEQHYIRLRNNGTSNITLTVGWFTKTILPRTEWASEVSFDKITVQSAAGTQEMSLKTIQNTSYKRKDNWARKQLLNHPTFTKYGTKPVFKKSQATWVVGDIYFPAIIEVRSILGESALDTFYLYYSTDHSTGPGGIGMATAPHPAGPWKDRGMVFVDTTDGEQTETPCVLWNEKTKKFHMYYHQNYYASGDTGVYPSQATCLALSDDGVTFTIQSNPLIKVDSEFPGDGHTGYARVSRVGDLWIMRHAMGGTNFSHSGVSYSKDGLTWLTDPRPIIGGAEWATHGVDRKVGVNDVFLWRNQYWANVNDNAWASGSGDSTPAIYVSPFTSVRTPGPGLFEILKVGGAGAWDETSIRNINIFEYEDKLYAFYEGVNSSGENAFGLAIGEV